MSQPKKQELINEIESLPVGCYGEVLDFMQFLKQKSNLSKAVNSSHPLIQFAGALAEIDLSEPEDPLPEQVDAI